MGLTAQVHQVAFSSQKGDHWKTILQRLEASDANVNVFTGYAMGLPSTGLTAPFVHENAESLHGAFITTLVE